MGIRGLLTAMALLLFLAANASPQGYMGTVTTGTGIVPPLTVGSGAIQGTTVGAVAQSANLTGSWSIDLKGPSGGHLELQVFQSQDLILGKGVMTTDGTGQSVIAAGSIAGTKPTIFVSPIDGGEVLRLQLSISGAQLSGGYDASTAAGTRWLGAATGSIALASGQKEPTIVGRAANEKAYSGAFVGRSVPGQNEETEPSLVTRNVSYFQSVGGQGQTTATSGESAVTSGSTTVTSSY